MIKSRIAVASALLAVAGAANAAIEFSMTPALVTDYDFRGLSQNDESETLQLGLNFKVDNGAYFGAWASEVDLNNDAVWELDLMAGFAGGDSNESFGYDVGAIFYTFPSSHALKDTYEVYAGISKGMFSGKVWFAPDYYNEKSVYAEANAAVPLPHGLTLGVHAGYSFGEAYSHYEYVDYSVGLTKALGKFDLNVKYVNSNDFKDPVVGRNAWIASLSTTLPWRK
ncbi:MAG: TorF family putative porin [Steroidobacteraceae bacterium]